MPVSQETAARADHPVQTPIYDKEAYTTPSDTVPVMVRDSPEPVGESSSSAASASNTVQLSGQGDRHDSEQGNGNGKQREQPSMPSEVVQPGVADDAAQQGATQPGSGSAVPAGATGATGASGAAGAGAGHNPTFKEKVIGYAKKTRGATLGKSGTKEQGERILSGEEKFEPKKVGPGAKKERSGSL
ncbi:hypothetical protein EIP91_001785 [Steccherinum ochraceum]|uniref:Uncharacterized protein n=1 Tax=Steccherinum ochraceum TaxID=92696 RepID=A0A4R0RSC9_9APHY|nr:hypothetical protein EIP91_001785 [Steccherinum ochraceum]